jgi:6-pyruvoyltetrahydropterin/6-carboxytetrahydropterin synthase
MYEVCVSTSFSAAHILNGHPGPCSSLHGHNWKVDTFFSREGIDSLGMVIDFAEINDELVRIVSNLDHKLLNEIPPFDEKNPTAENIAKWIFDELGKNLSVHPSKVTVHETDNSSASYF